LPVLSGADTVRAFERAGWSVARQRGSHVVMTKAGESANLSIPQHRELDTGALRGLVRASGLTVDEFIALVG
jgi:predicted RNA binding protein YcfA (HicA-like mRNA interferase family)